MTGAKVREERDYHALMAMREYVGFGYMKLSQRTGVPESTVGGWIRGDPKYGNPLTRRQRWEDYGSQPLPSTKLCTKCKKVKERNDFYIMFRPKTRNAYLFSMCKQCCREKSEAVRKADPERHRERSRKAHHDRRRKAQRMLVLNAEPFLRHIEPLHGALPPNHQRRVLAARESGRITYASADDILTGQGEPGAMRSLYGEVT
jgi:hypothetical protein